MEVIQQCALLGQREFEERCLRLIIIIIIIIIITTTTTTTAIIIIKSAPQQIPTAGETG